MPREHKRRAYIRVPSSIWQEDSTPEERGICVALVGYMVERWARDGLNAADAIKVVLRPGVLAEVTGRERLGAGLARLRQALGTTSARVWQDGRNVVVEWPKVAEYQGLSRLDTPLSDTAPAPAPVTAPAKRERAPASPSKASKILCPAYTDWPPERLERLAAKPGAGAVQAAIARVCEWSSEQDMRRTMRGWEATVVRAIRERWAGNSSGPKRGGRDSNYVPPPVSKGWEEGGEFNPAEVAQEISGSLSAAKGRRAPEVSAQANVPPLGAKL